MSTWSSDIEKAANLLGITVSNMVRLLALHIFSGIVQKTPVDKGYLRAAWNLSLNREEYVTTPGVSGNHNLPSQLGLFPRVFITNGLPYAAVVEYGLYPGIGDKTKQGSNPSTGSGIFSRQAPKGMVELTLNEVGMALRQVVGN